MQLGMIGLGRMGANMVRRLLKGGHQCVVFDRSPKAVNDLAQEKAGGQLFSARPCREARKAPRVVADGSRGSRGSNRSRIFCLISKPGDILIDGGNSYYVDDIRRAKELAAKHIHYVDVGTSGGVWGLERGYCMMIGGEKDVVAHLDPIFATLAPGTGDFRARPDARSLAAPPNKAICTAVRTAPATLSRWFTTVSSTVSWPLMRRG